MLLFSLLLFVINVKCSQQTHIVSSEKCSISVYSCDDRYLRNTCDGGLLKNNTYFVSTLNEQTDELILQNCAGLTVYLNPRIVVKTIKINNCSSLKIKTDLDLSATVDVKSNTALLISNSNITKLDAASLKGNYRAVKLENVAIQDVDTFAIHVSAEEFTVKNCNIENVHVSGVEVNAHTIVLNNNDFTNVFGLYLEGKDIEIARNKFKDIETRSLRLKASNIQIKNNDFVNLKSNALTECGCVTNKTAFTTLNFEKNTVRNSNKNSFKLNFKGCDLSYFSDNKINCGCNETEWIFETNNRDVRDKFFGGGNYCLDTPCNLPVDVLNYIETNRLCNYNLSDEIMCLWYEDKIKNLSKKDIAEDTVGTTDMTPAFYMIKRADGNQTAYAPNFNEQNVNITNRTTIPMSFESSNDFVEALRNTKNHKTPISNFHVTPKMPKVTVDVEANRQRALNFYKNIYVQLHDKT